MYAAVEQSQLHTGKRCQRHRQVWAGQSGGSKRGREGGLVGWAESRHTCGTGSRAEVDSRRACKRGERAAVKKLRALCVEMKKEGHAFVYFVRDRKAGEWSVGSGASSGRGWEEARCRGHGGVHTSKGKLCCVAERPEGTVGENVHGLCSNLVKQRGEGRLTSGSTLWLASYNSGQACLCQAHIRITLQ